MENNNLDLWDKVSETDPKHTKKVTFGRSFTSINAQYQIKMATEQFGMYGKNWGIKSIDHSYINLDNNQIMCLVKAIFFINESEFPVSTSIFIQEWSHSKKYYLIDDEFAKKAETDITTKALSKLGFNADVFLGSYDDNRYVNSLKDKYGNNEVASTTATTATQTTSPPEKPWLNKWNKDKSRIEELYTKVLTEAKKKNITVEVLKGFYKISKEVQAELEKDLL